MWPRAWASRRSAGNVQTQLRSTAAARRALARTPRRKTVCYHAAGCASVVVFAKRLILWDIDGTLIASGGAGMRALQVALRDVFGLDGSLADIDFAGRTDVWIMREVFRKFGLAATTANFTHYFEGYIAALPRELENPQARVLPGVREILRAVADHGQIAQGLLTGNMRRGAQVKLAHHGLWEYFAFGAFADDSEHRNDLGPHAVRRALEHHGVDFATDAVWIVGDTPHDIACGKAIGARTLAVGTGGTSLEQLGAHHPTATVPDLSDTTAVLRLLES
jgi:phosphoglycolate phosphatase-like HAD superfamily hydrolase